MDTPQTHFRDRKCLRFYSNCIDFVSKGPVDNKSSSNGLALNVSIPESVITKLLGWRMAPHVRRQLESRLEVRRIFSRSRLSFWQASPGLQRYYGVIESHDCNFISIVLADTVAHLPLLAQWWQISCPVNMRQVKLNRRERFTCPDSKVHGANMEPTWVLSAPDGPHVGLMNLATRVAIAHSLNLADDMATH